MMEEEIMNPQQALATLVRDLSHFRRHRQTKMERIPQELWSRTLQMTQWLPLTEVSKACKMNPHYLKEKLRKQAVPPSGELNKKASVRLARMHIATTSLLPETSTVVLQSERGKMQIDIRSERHLTACLQAFLGDMR